MKYITLILILAFHSVGISQTGFEVQRGIVAAKEGTDKAILIKEHSKIQIWLNGQKETIAGKYTIQNDSTIQIDSVDYALSSISKMRAPKGALRVLGVFLTVAGGTTIGFGLGAAIAVLVTADPGTFEQVLGLLASAILVGIGIIPTAIGIPLMVTGKLFKQADWQFSIQK